MINLEKKIKDLMRITVELQETNIIIFFFCIRGISFIHNKIIAFTANKYRYYKHTYNIYNIQYTYIHGRHLK